jgi:hypothetical protein
VVRHLGSHPRLVFGVEHHRTCIGTEFVAGPIPHAQLAISRGMLPGRGQFPSPDREAHDMLLSRVFPKQATVTLAALLCDAIRT